MPVILEYFIPGFLFVSFFQYFTSKKETTYKIIGSIVISYVLKAICSVVHQHLLPQRIFIWSERVVILSLFALIASLLCVLITELKLINKVFLKINCKSIHDDIWQDVIDYRNGTTMRIVCDNAIYTGVLVGHEEKGSDSWFIFDDYIVEENDVTYTSEDMKIKSRLAINFKNVKRVELYYGEYIPTKWERLVSWLRN